VVDQLDLRQRNDGSITASYLLVYVRTDSRNTLNADGAIARYPPAGFFESRTATCGPGQATSMHSPLVVDRLDLRQLHRL
jgi:hypothetical protein